MAKPTLSDLILNRGTTPVRLAVAARVSVPTVYRARLGQVPGPTLLAAIAKALRVSEKACRAAIERSGK